MTAADLQAASAPFPDRQVDIVGRGQSVDLFLKELFGQAGLKTRISSAVRGPIQGRFTGKPAEIWGQLSRAFNLLSYYDGSVVLIYSASEVQSRTITAASPQGVVTEAARLKLTDGNNTIRAGGSTVIASGVPEFIRRIETLAGSVAPKAAPALAVAAPKLLPAVASGSDIVSPRLSGPLTPAAVTSGPAVSNLRSTVVSRASARSPYEVRIFYLRYAKADDTITENQGRTAATPGVASVLRGVMGDGCPSETVSTSGNFDIARQALPRMGGMAPGSGERYADEYPEADQTSVGNRPACSRDVNGPRIELDPANNAVIVRDRPESMTVYEDMISSLDIEPRGVEIEATIIELDTNRLKELGLDFNFDFGGMSRIFGGISVAPAGPMGTPTVQANLITGSKDAFNVRLNALEKNGSAHVVSRPRLSTLNNVAAEFGNQVEYYVRVAGEREAQLFPIKVGMVMRVTPSVVYDGGELRTRLSIDIQDGSPSGLVVDGIPGIKTSRINTNAIVKQGESLLIGGLSVEQEFDYKSGVPGLSKIPVVGNAFKKRSKGGGRLERLFLITPRVISQKAGTETVTAQPAAVPLEALERGYRKSGRQARP